MSNYVGVAGGVVQGYAQYEKAEAQEQELKYNKEIASIQAKQAEYATKLQVYQHKRAVFDLIAQTRAGAISAGVELSGSPLEILMETGREGEFQQRMIEYEGMLKARGLREEADLLEYQSNVAMKVGRVSAAGTALSGGSSSYTPTKRRSQPSSDSDSDSGGAYQHHRSDNKH